MTFEVADGAIDLDGTAWTWTGSVLIAFGPVDGEGRAIRVYDPYTGEVRTSSARIPADGPRGLGSAVTVAGIVYLVGLRYTECPSDYCVDVGSDRVYLFDPRTDALGTLDVADAGAFFGLLPVAAGTKIYGVSLNGSGTGRIWHMDTESMMVDFTEISSGAPTQRADQIAAVWTGNEIVLFGGFTPASEDGTWSNAEAFDPIGGTSRTIGSHGFSAGPAPHGAAWDGERILLVGSRTSGNLAPDNQLVWLDPHSGELQLLGTLPGGTMPAGLIFDGSRFLAVGSDGRCVLSPGQSLWVDPGGTSPDPAGARQTPIAAINVTPVSYSRDLGKFWVEVDACSSTDDGILVRAEITRDSGIYWQEPGDFSQGTWLAPGEHSFTVRVWDDEGLEASVTQVLTLDAAPPEILVTWTVEGLTVHADASGSTDQSGPIQRFAWDWGDGTADPFHPPDADPLPPQPTTSHTYTISGTYNVRLTVTGPDGQRSARGEVIVVGPQTDLEPDDREPESPSTTDGQGGDVPMLGTWGVALAFLCASLLRRSRD